MRGWCVLLLAACSFQHGQLGRDGGPGSDGDAGDASIIDAPPDSRTIDTPPGSSLRQKTITINTVSGTHTDFPLWVLLIDADLAARARMDGTDIHFLAGTTPLDYQIQRWTSSTGRLEAWVRVPSLATGTQIIVRYGDVAAAHAPNAPNTFTGYNAVWHLDDQLNNATIADARGTTNGTGVSLGPSDSVAAQLGRGVDFNDNAEQITFTNPLSGNMPHTISAWVNQGTTTTNDSIITVGTNMNNQARWFHSRFDNPTIAVGFYANDLLNPNVNVIGAGWVLLHWVYEGTSRMTRLYRGGAEVATFQHAMGVNTQGDGGTIGHAPIGFGGNMGINGILDEVRIINVARGADWIATEFANQSSPTTFYTVSAEQIP